MSILLRRMCPWLGVEKQMLLRGYLWYPWFTSWREKEIHLREKQDEYIFFHRDLHQAIYTRRNHHIMPLTSFLRLSLTNPITPLCRGIAETACRERLSSDTRHIRKSRLVRIPTRQEKSLKYSTVVAWNYKILELSGHVCWPLATRGEGGGCPSPRIVESTYGT